MFEIVGTDQFAGVATQALEHTGLSFELLGLAINYILVNAGLRVMLE